MGHYALFGIQEGKKELEDGNVGGDLIIIENENALPRDKLPRSFYERSEKCVRSICAPCK